MTDEQILEVASQFDLSKEEEIIKFARAIRCFCKTDCKSCIEDLEIGPFSWME